MAIVRYFDKSVLREMHGRLLESDSPEAARCLGAVRALQGCSFAFDPGEIKQVCRGMLRLSRADRKTVDSDPEIGVLYENIKGWLVQRAGMLEDGNRDRNKEVLGDLMWNVCPYWIRFRLMVEKAGRKEKEE